MGKTKASQKLFSIQAAAAQGLSGACITVLLILWEYANVKSGAAWPSIQTISTVGKLNTRTVQKALRQLEAHNLIRTLIGTGKASSRYYPIPVLHPPFKKRIQDVALSGANKNSPLRGEACESQCGDESNAPESLGNFVSEGRTFVRGGAKKNSPGGEQKFTQTLLNEPNLDNPSEPSAHSLECENTQHEDYIEDTTTSEASGDLSKSYKKEDTSGREASSEDAARRQQVAIQLRQLETLIERGGVTEENEPHWSGWLNDILDEFPGNRGDPIGGWAYRLLTDGL